MRLLSRTIKRFGWKCHAFCLMPNHFHLVIEAECEALSRGMHWMTGIYAQRFNTRHDRVGHLVQNRFTARLIEGEDALERVSAYVLENPVKAELCERPEDWRWVGLGQPRA